MTVEKLEDGRFFVGCDWDQLHDGGLNLFKLELFFWHPESYYGTMLEEMKREGRFGIVLPAWEAVRYWAEPGLLQHGRGVEWDSGFEERREEAELLQAALANGWFVPGLRTDPDTARTHAAWRLLRDDEAHPDPAFAARCARFGWDRLDRQLDAVLKELASAPGPASSAWKSLTDAHPAAVPLAVSGAVAAAEEEELFWEQTGFRSEGTPYTIGLRLEDPPEEGLPWRLRPVLADRANPEIQYAFEWDGRPAKGTQLPAAWAKEAAAAAISRKAKRWRLWYEALEEDMDEEQVWEFVESGSERLMSAGVPIYLPPWWKELLNTRPAAVSQLKPSANASGLLGAEQLLAFDWKVSIGGAEIDVAVFHEAVRNNRRFIRLGEQWVLLHPSWVRSFRKFFQRMSRKETLTLSEVVELYLSGGRESATEQQDSGAKDGQEPVVRWEVRLNDQARELIELLERRSREEYSPPAGLKPVLRNYQAAGANWLLLLRRTGFGACLADDMGLGKTLQFITYLVELKERGELQRPALIVCPTSVLGNWQKELERFAPGLRVYLHYGARRAASSEFRDAASGADLVITSYSLAHADRETLRELQWTAVCIDEAQNIKNPHGKQSLAVRSLQADHRIALTGTPVENRLSELWTIFDFINPGYLGTLSGFQKRYGWLDKASEASDDPKRQEHSGQLQRLIRPFLLRRVKNDPAIQLELPDKNENMVYVPLTVEQGALYELELQNMLERIDRLEPMERRGLILATLGRLKRICDHPALADGEKGNRQDAGTGADKSHKLQRLLEMAEEVLDEDGQGIIFTQYVEMGELIRKAIEQAFGCAVDFLHGGVGKEERDRMVERFQRRKQAGTGRADYGFLVLSLKAGGTGLNLTAANHVFHYDRWWNPAVEEQATDRAYRIGQTRDVQVHKFVVLGTLEERIDEMIARKKQLSSQIIGSGEHWITELTTDELKELFALRREWVRD